MQVSRGWQSLFRLVQMVIVAMGVITVTTEKGFAVPVTPLTFQAEVSNFDKQWVNIKTKDKSFRVPRKTWEKYNGTARTGVQKAELDPETFRDMTVDAHLPK